MKIFRSIHVSVKYSVIVLIYAPKIIFLCLYMYVKLTYLEKGGKIQLYSSSSIILYKK